MRRSRAICSLPLRIAVLLALTAVTALLAVSGCRTAPPSPVGVTAKEIVAQSGHYVGNEACAECHQAEHNTHRRSRHATTMRTAEEVARLPGAVPAGPIAGSDYAVRARPGEVRFERASDSTVGGPIQYVLGSGKAALTFVGDFGPDRFTEYRMTYLTRQRSWFVTPGQGSLANLDPGKVHEMGMARRCVLCHAVKTADNACTPAPGFLGVGCESCHGPGGEHVAAMRSGSGSDLKIDGPKRWAAPQIEAMCSRCHRSLDDVPIEKEVANLTARFQGYGLEQSACYRKSNGRLSCVTCHDPHTDVPADRRAYEKACLSCHMPAATGHQRACPVNPRAGCIPCHMPSRRILADRRVPLAMADHLIMAYPAKR